MFQTFFREKLAINDTDMYMNTDMYMYTYRYVYMCVYVCVFVSLLCGAMSCRVSNVDVGWVVGCGVVLLTCHCRGLFPCVVVPLIASS